jgi:alkylated DNA repair dioxygenase AlkB
VNLFDNSIIRNILPFDGKAVYHGLVLNNTEALHYYQLLFDTIDWRNDEANIFGKQIITKRKVAWYGDTTYSYTYSNTTKQALLWTNELLELKELVQKITKTTYNSCLLNLYHNGSEGMAWHSDDEKALGASTTIASLTLGAPRKFAFKHKHNKHTESIVLENGSLLTMEGETQQHWLHRLPPTKKVNSPRINLTFRTIIP